MERRIAKPSGRPGGSFSVPSARPLPKTLNTTFCDTSGKQSACFRVLCSRDGVTRLRLNNNETKKLHVEKHMANLWPRRGKGDEQYLPDTKGNQSHYMYVYISYISYISYMLNVRHDGGEGAQLH